MRNAFLKTFARLRRDEKGVTLVEYGIAIILAILVGGGGLSLLATSIDDQLGVAGSCMSQLGSGC